MAHKTNEACQLWIDEQIKAGLSEGKPYSIIGREISEQIMKYFEVFIPAPTIAKRATREQSRTNVPTNVVSIQDISDIPKRSQHNEKYPTPPPKPVFNETNENIEWAKWSWNPVTGCLHGCEYCYARDIANRFYKEKFKPTFHPHRLQAPFNTKSPANQAKGNFNVFVCSMADLFGEWVKQEWIDKIMDVVSATPQWTYLFLTKNPKRLLSIKWPKNSWVGTTVDCQDRVTEAERVFSRLDAPVHFLSCEPLMESINFTTMNMFDWLIIGGQSQGVTWKQPEWLWVENLLWQARKDKVKVYFKPNLTVVPKEYPA